MLTAELRDRYLDLMKRMLTGALTEDGDLVLGGGLEIGHKTWKWRAADALAKVAATRKIELVQKKPYDAHAREHGMDWPSRAESMIGLKRMANIQECIASVIADDVPGDLIETGVWRGGATIFMKANLVAWGDSTRRVWVADSFEGLPAPDPARYPADIGDITFQFEGLRIGVNQVRHNFERYGLLDDKVMFLEGWFKDTLPTAPIDELALLRLDGDLYESTWQALEPLYPKLSVGGYCIVDDWHAYEDQAQVAVKDYFASQGISEEIIEIDGVGVYWRKTS